jgi:hypothetical protein
VSVQFDLACPVLRVAGVYRDAWRLYRLLARRSVLAAAIVFGALALAKVGGHYSGSRAVAIALGIVASVLDWAGPVLVQGALIELVANIHEGRPVESLGRLYARARARFWPLFWGSLVYVLGILGGLVLLIVPGLIAFARWSLFAPFVVLEEDGVEDAIRKSSRAVRGQTGRVLAIVGAAFLLGLIPADLVFYLLLDRGTQWQLFSFVWSSLTAPFEAHVLSVLYYRLTDPERPVIWEGSVGSARARPAL